MDKDEKASSDGRDGGAGRPPGAKRPPSDPSAERSDPSVEPPTYEDARAALELATPEAEATQSTKATTEATEVTPSSPDAAKQPRAR